MKTHNNRCIYVLYGPTGVGKTESADLLALTMPIEIINMDVGQLYEPLKIGTAKPDWQNSSTPHHMFDRMKVPQDFSCAAYRKEVEQLVHDIWQRGATPLFVGGSGFYLRSLFFPAENVDSQDIPLPYAPEINLWDALFAIDPDRALKIPRNDLYRITRALTIWHATGIKPSLNSPLFKPLAPTVLLFLTRDRAELYNRINNRVDVMLNAGWQKEIVPLMGTQWQSFIMRKKLIGYDDLISFFLSDTGTQNLSDTIALIKQRTRNYAKRQETYSRMLERELLVVANTNPSSALQLHRLNLTSMDVDLYIKRLLAQVNEL